MAEIRSVPAVRLGKSPDLQGTLYRLQQKQTTLEQVLANPPQESIVIPIDCTSETRSFNLDCFVRTGAPDTYRDLQQAPPLHVVFRCGPDQLCVYSAPVGIASGRKWLHLRVWLDPNLYYHWGTNTWFRNRGQGGGGYRHPNIGYFHRNPARILAVIIGSWKWSDFMIAELRVWNRALTGNWFHTSLRGRRRDGRERGLVGYWKLAEGTGTELRDSGRSGTVGKLTGGTWTDAGQSGLNLDCTLEDVQVLRDSVRNKKKQYRDFATAAAARNQEAELLATQISAHRGEHYAMEKKLKSESDNVLKQLRELEAEHLAWQTDIKDGGRVALDTFSKTVAEEVDRASQRLDEAESLYSLQGVDLEVKMLPVQTAEEEDFRVVFPTIDDPNVQSEQLSTLSLNFATRPKARDRHQGITPDVQGYTELAARRRLAQDGFRVEVLDEAVAREEEVGRVRGQAPEPNSERALDSIVTLVVGRASGIALATGTTSNKE